MSGNERTPGSRRNDAPPPSSRVSVPSSRRTSLPPTAEPISSPPSSLTSVHKAIAALDKMKSRLDASERRATEPIAIIGMACRFPGGADSPETFFHLLEAGVDAVTQVPEERWRLDTSKDADGSAERRAMRWGAFLREPVDRFDARFFGISPREAAHLDPQQRLLLEIGWEALEQAGIDPARLVGSATGVFVGITTDDYADLCRMAGPEGEDVYSATGNGHCFAPGRLSYTFGFQGPSLAVDTACSSSLVAVHLACQSLRAHEATVALAGGVNLMLSPDTTRLTATTQGLSPDGRCKTFDAAANGFVRGEGCGLVVLKRLSDAQRDGDRILATIRGSAVNQDGRSTGLTAPNVLSQQAMLRQALASARVDAAEIGYVEAHGTGTSLGDPIELEALRAVLGKVRDDGSTCALGAAKTNIGHLEAAAGIAGLIKTVMVLRREMIPRNLHFRTLNPRTSLDDTPFVIPTENLPWKRGDKPRLAGVSSFGMSGTNAHLILEEGPHEKPDEATEPAPSTYLLPISARSPEALRELVTAYAAALEHADGPRLSDLVSTASLRRTHHDHRLAITGPTREKMAEALAVLVRNGAAGGVIRGHAAATVRPRVVFVFPGQGSQWLGMGRQLFADEPVFRASLAASDEVIRRQGEFSVIDELTATEARSHLHKINVVQPVLFAIQVALAALWRSWGIEPDAVIGHSMGEVAAARVAGILSLEDAAKVICRRSRLLVRVSGKGAMALVELDRATAQEALAGYEDRLGVAVSNGPQSTVISGDPAALEEVIGALEKAEIFCRRVKVDVASHSPQMDPLRDDLLATLRNVRPRAARIAMRSTVTGETLRGPELDAAYWVKNLRDPVLFLDATQKLIDEGHTLFVEISPHPILIPSIEENLQEKRQRGAALPSLRRSTDERQTLLESLGALYAFGHAVEWKHVYPTESRSVSLPSYPWQRERHWLRDLELAERSSSTTTLAAPIPTARIEAREGWLWEVQWHLQDRARATCSLTRGAWLVLSDRGGAGQALAQRLRAAGARCVCAVSGATLRAIEPDAWEIDPRDPDAYRAFVREALPPNVPVLGVVHLGSLDAPSADDTTAATLVASQVTGAESALLLIQAVLRAELAVAPQVWLITRGAVAAGGEKSLSVGQAPLWGLGRTLQGEHPELACRIVDLGQRPIAIEIEDLIAELATTDREDQIALRPGGRFAARLVPHTPLPAPAEPARLRADATYLVTGGLGGLGLAVASWMVERGARHVVLAGRSAPSAAAREAIAGMEEAGAEIFVMAADASQRGDVELVLERIGATYPPLRGVIHAAGVLQDRTVLELSIEAMRSVAAPKMQGAWNLHAATRARGLDLDFFVLYASAASILGSAGQGNYAAANAFLDALAHHRRAQGLPGLSLDWGPFSQIGLAAAQANRGERLAAMGFRNITPAEGHDVLGSLLSGSGAQVGIIPMEIDRAIASMPQLGVAPYFAQLQLETKREHRKSQRPPRASITIAIAIADPAERRSLLERLVVESLAHVMRLDPSQIERSAPFHGYGFDSLMGLELRNRLQTELDLKLSMADIVTHAQVDKLAALLDERLALAAKPDASAPAADEIAKIPLAAATVIPPPGSWIVIPRAAPAARMRLFCFPYAGGAASVFSTWPGGLPAEIEVCAIQPPGRHERLHEPLLHSVDDMVAALVPALLPYLDRPFAMFGHCLGAIVMFEVLRELSEKHGLRPAHVFASGAPAPRRYLVPSVAARTRDEFLELLRAIGFAQAGVLEDEDAERHLLPAVKADFDLAARYAHAPSHPLDAPLTAFAGQDDSFAPLGVVDEWRHETTSWSTRIVFPGEHYFIVPERDTLLRIIGEELLLRLASTDHRTVAARGVIVRKTTGSTPPSPRARLFCFPGLGRGSSIYDGWLASQTDPTIEVCAVELGGRGARADELPLGRIEEVVEHLAPRLLEHLDRPFAFFGLDLGALVMFEIARELRRVGGPLPDHLFVGAAMAPQIHYFAPMQYLPSERLFAGLRIQGLALDESAPAERALRAECAAMTSYSFVDEPALSIPITAFLGERDSFIPPGGVSAWKTQTTASFAMHLDPGTHDLIRGERSTLLATMRAAMKGTLR
jgi:acyl transferase domain-containing protein/surfactin synthase thioesterase subunit/acyl carrier protein